MKKDQDISFILRNAFERLKSQNPSFSIRAVAKKAGMSHVAVGKLLNGQIGLAPHRVDSVIKAFQLDSLASSALKNAVVHSKLDGMKDSPLKQKTSRRKPALEFNEKSSKYFTALENWYELPILDLLTCKKSPRTADEISKRLGVPSAQIKSAIARLMNAGLLEEKGDRLIKKERYIRFPNKTPSYISSKYNRQVLQKASNELSKVEQADFNKRLIKNICLAVNPNKIEEAKERLNRALYEISLDLSDGESSQIYFLSGLLFPVSTEE